MNDFGSGDIKIKLYMAMKTLVGSESINDRLRRVAMGIQPLLEKDLPSSPPSLRQRYTWIKQKLLSDHRLLSDNPVQPNEKQGVELAEEFLAVFTILCDPNEFDQVLSRPTT